MTEGIAGKVVVITGARSGLGEETARLLCAESVDINDILYRPTGQEF